MSTPRNAQVPALKVLGVLYPDIDTKPPNDPAFITAEKTLADVLSETRTIALLQSVRWELDRDWLAAHHINVPRQH